MKKKLENVKGAYDLKRFQEEYGKHQEYVKLSEKKYTPRGMGHRSNLNSEVSNYSLKRVNII
jgi:hypothetical protein